MNTTHFYRWWVVIACTLVTACSGGIFNFAFTAFFNPIADEFQWSYALVSLAFSLRGFEAGIFAPVVGIACDRIGTGKLLFWGVIITGLGYILIAATQNLWSFYLIFIFLGIGISSCGIITTMTVVSRWFGEKASLAMGIVSTGIAMGGLIAPVITVLIDSYGWRQTTIMIGIAFWLICIPLALSIKNPHPASDCSSGEPEHAVKQKKKNDSFSITQIMKGKTFWIVSSAVLFSGLAGMALSVHQMPHLMNIGISRQSAAFTVSTFAIASIIGRLSFGAIADRFDKRRCFAVAAFLESIGVVFFILSNTLDLIIPSLVVMGIGFGGLIPLRPGLQVQLFGIANFGSIQGLLMIFVTIGITLSPLFAGWMFDLFGDYKTAFIILAALTATAIPIVLSLPKADG